MTSDAHKQAARTGPVAAEARVAALEKEVVQLREAVVSHADVDRAIGVIVAFARIPPGRAWDVLRELSQHTNIKLRHVALLIIQWGHTGVLPAEIHAELRRRLQGCQGRRPRAQKASSPPPR
ncbi:ANTAR domain-containing protein [Streptomyces sp. SGAir0957]